MKFIIEIEINEERLKSTSGDDDVNIPELIEREFGWLAESGIYLRDMKKKNESEG